MKLISLLVPAALGCNQCDGCPDGVQVVEPLGVKLLCKDNKAYVKVNEETNFAKIDARRLNGSTSAWLCAASHYTMETSYVKAGTTHFSAYRIVFADDGSASIDTSDFTFSETDGITLDNGDVVTNQVKAGNAGDCYAWANCDDTKKGSFSIDLTGSKVGIDMDPNFQWTASGWPEYMQMADYAKNSQTVTARCGGWCGSCAPNTDDGNIPVVKWQKPQPVESRIWKLADKFAEVLELGMVKEHVQTKANELIQKMTQSMEDQWRKLDERCWYPDTWKTEDDDDDQVRFNREDPCKGLNQIMTGFSKWGKIFNRNCKNPSKTWAYHERRERKAEILKNRMLAKMKCNV